MKLLRILYFGDIMARPGREVVKRFLPQLRAEVPIDIVCAQAENVTHGKGMQPTHFRELQAAGIDVFMGGNHTFQHPQLISLLQDKSMPVLAPCNDIRGEWSWGAKTIPTASGPLLAISLLGTTFPQREGAVANPLVAIDDVLERMRDQERVATIVNFHGDFSSEKRVIGYYLDGRVSAVIGDHWHVPTADAMVLPKGTAHITDVGMCGTLHSSLGVTKEVIMSRWRDGTRIKNEIADGGPYQLNAALVTVNTHTGLAESIEPIIRYIDNVD
jgi:metallophosphoesterase (TIGR00282 family)